MQQHRIIIGDVWWEQTDQVCVSKKITLWLPSKVNMEVNQEVKTGDPEPLRLLKILGKRMSGQAVGLKNTEFNIHLFYFSFPL